MADALKELLDEREIRRITDLLFHHTDAKDWPAAVALYVEGPINVDMTSLAGGEPLRISASELFAGFDQGLHAQKLSHHMTANAVVDLDGDRATVRAHGYAINVLLTTDPAGLWETWGVYELGFRRTADGWRMDGFRYDSKHMRGDDAVRTHTL